MTNRSAFRSRRLLPLAGLAALTLACSDTNPMANNNNDLGTPDLAMGTAPEASSVMPAMGPTSGMTLLTITGNNFRTGATVTVGGLPCTQVTVVAATQITCMTPANLGKSGKFDVVVTVDGKSATLTQAFSYYLSMISFTARPRLQTPLGTRSLVLGDWNGDKKIDLATANETANSVSVRMGSGDGDFSGGMDYSFTAGTGTATNPFSITSGDINGDGVPDLITPNLNSNNVSVLLGSANGMFQAQASSSGGGNVGNLPQATVVGDFNADGSPDVVSLAFNSGRLTLLVGNKTSQFATGITTSTQTSPWSVAIGDFNKDGKPDVVVPRISNTTNISVFLGTGMQAAPFQAAANYTAGTNPYWVATGDWNGDGNLDIAAANTMSNNVTLLIGSASGMMTVSGTMLGVGMRPEHIATADFNNDGLPDLVTANTVDNNISLLLAQDKAPTYANAQSVNPGTGITPKWIATADLNGDGKMDMVVADYKTANNAGVVTLLNTSQ